MLTENGIDKVEVTTYQVVNYT